MVGCNFQVAYFALGVEIVAAVYNLLAEFVELADFVSIIRAATTSHSKDFVSDIRLVVVVDMADF